jgi:hypothetical protein
MRQLKRPVGLVALACVFALSAAPAVAHEFIASSPGKTRGSAFNGSLQEWTFKEVKVTCKVAITKGSINSTNSKVVFDTVRYQKCDTKAHIGNEPIHLKTRFKTPVSFEYHANGFAELGGESTSEVSLTAPTSIELTIPSIKCLIEIPPQTIPVKAEKKPTGEYTAVGYTNEEIENKHLKKFPSGFQKVVLIENALKNIEYTFVEGQCSEFKKIEAKNGMYKGTLLDELIGGDLSFE